MTDDPHINFRQQVAADPKARAKWQEVSDEALAAIEADYGVRLDRERLLESSAIKLNVLASADMEWRADIEALPEVAQAIENKRLLAALNDPKDRLHEDANAALMALKPEERISAARQMGGVVGHVRGRPADEHTRWLQA